MLQNNNNPIFFIGWIREFYMLHSSIYFHTYFSVLFHSFCFQCQVFLHVEFPMLIHVFHLTFLSPLSLPNPPYLLMLKHPLDCYPHSTTSPFVLRHCDYKQQVHRLNINKIVRISSVFIDSFRPIWEHYTKCFSLAMDCFAVYYRYEWFVICPFCAMCNKKTDDRWFWMKGCLAPYSQRACWA